MATDPKPSDKSMDAANTSAGTPATEPAGRIAPSLTPEKAAWPPRNATEAHEGGDSQTPEAGPPLDDPTVPSTQPAKKRFQFRDVTGMRQGEDSQVTGTGPPLDQPTEIAEDSSAPPKKRWQPTNVTETREGYGLQIFGWDVPGRKPPPKPEESELRKVAESKHRYPDLPQAPAREQFADEAAFNAAMSQWLVKVAPVVLRRNKFSKPRPKPGGN